MKRRNSGKSGKQNGNASKTRTASGDGTTAPLGRGKDKAQRVAFERVKKKVPSSFDISLLGGGYAFLLEFSTVVVIIFILLILGILKIMEGKDISTIMAAIAGYVLGKATSDSTKGQKASPPPDPLKIAELEPRP